MGTKECPPQTSRHNFNPIEPLGSQTALINLVGRNVRSGHRIAEIIPGRRVFELAYELHLIPAAGDRVPRQGYAAIGYEDGTNHRRGQDNDRESLGVAERRRSV